MSFPIKINAARRLVESATWFDSLSDFQKKEYLREHPDSKYAHGYHPSDTESEDVEDESDEYEPVQVETLGSRIRGMLVKALGGEPNRVFKNRKGYLSAAYFDRPDGSQRKVKLMYSGDMFKTGKKYSSYGYWKDADTYVYLTKQDWKGLSKEQKRSVEDRQRAYGVGADDGTEDSGESRVSKKSNLRAPQAPPQGEKSPPAKAPAPKSTVQQQTQQMARPPKALDYKPVPPKKRK